MINRSSAAVEECREIIFAQTGWITHSRSLTKMDPSGARENHGDRPTADALLWKAMSKYPPRTTQRTVIPEDSLAFRRFNRKTKQLAKDTW